MGKYFINLYWFFLILLNYNNKKNKVERYSVLINNKHQVLPVQHNMYYNFENVFILVDR